MEDRVSFGLTIPPPKQCAEDLRAMACSGAKAITLRITSWNQRGQFQRLVHEVLPLLDEVRGV